MKTLLFLLLPLSIYSQSFSKLDSLAFMNQVDAVIKTTGKDFILTKTGKEQTVNYLMYSLNGSGKETFLLTYYVTTEGEDKNLEIKGLKKWNFRSIKGNYLTLFPIWNKFVDQSADKEKLSKSGYKMKGDFSFKEVDSPVWLLRF